MKISSLFIGLTVMCAIVYGVSGFYVDVSANYGYSSPSILAFANSSYELEDSLNSMAAPLKAGQLTFLDIPFVVLNTAWTVVTIPFVLVNTFSNLIITAVSAQTGIPYIPDWAPRLLSVLILAVLVFGILYAATRANI